MRHFHGIICYDGTHFFGWQKTIEGPSIQEALISSIHGVCQEDAMPEAASRTGRGVHARGQSVAFSIKKEINAKKLLPALNAHLPNSIRVTLLKETSSDFHPILDAKAKEYRYELSLIPFQYPMDHLYAWHIPHALDLKEMKQAANTLLREKNPTCRLDSIELIQGKNRLTIHLSGDRFLYKIARSLVGALVYVGRGKISSASIEKTLDSKKRENAGITAPAHGLFFHRVIY